LFGLTGAPCGPCPPTPAPPPALWADQATSGDVRETLGLRPPSAQRIAGKLVMP